MILYLWALYLEESDTQSYILQTVYLIFHLLANYVWNQNNSFIPTELLGKSPFVFFQLKIKSD
jgi:hypothetical protein